MSVIDTIDPDLLTNTIATLATIGPDGGPQLTAVWFLREGDRIIISAAARRQKTKNLAENPACSLLIFHPDTDDYYVELRGAAELIDDGDYALANRIGARYGSDFRTFDGPNDHRLIISLTPARALVTDER